VQSGGGEEEGPNTVNVIVPVGLAPPDSVELTEPAAIAVFTGPLPGAVTPDMLVGVRVQLIFTDAGAVVFVALMEIPGLMTKLPPPPPPPPLTPPPPPPPP
jgi:hypothetical protein